MLYATCSSPSVPGAVEAISGQAGAGSHLEVPSRGALNVDNKYEIIIFWSDEDDAFVADVPELPGCMAHGSSHADALRNAEEAIALWVDAARELGREVPQPKGRRLVFA
jgi:predicted RNase H-like HicB family nuclease